MREVRVDVSRMYRAVLPHEGEQGLGSRVPRRGPQRRDRARMHQRVKRSRDEPVIDEDILLDVERRVQPLEVARPVALDAQPERQILRARRRANRIGLHESKRVDRACEGCGPAETAGDGHAPKIVEGRLQRHRGQTDLTVVLRPFPRRMVQRGCQLADRPWPVRHSRDTRSAPG